ncbi:MAG: alpha/beta hydrolase, partial [Nocardioidaceae bacterium]
MLPLLSLRLLVVLVVAAGGCLVAAGVLLVRRQGRRRLPLVSASVVVGLVLSAGAAAAGVNRHFVLYRSWRSLFGLYSRDLVAAHSPAALARALAPLPVGAPARTHGQLLSLRIPGTASGLAAGSSLVYLPPQYGTPAWAGRGFPVVEAIPGSPGAPGDYVNGIRADTQLDAAIGAHLLPPVIVVFPPSNLTVLRSLECVDTADGLRDETYLTTDVRSWVGAHLDAAPGRWTVMGYSTGGYCALDLSLRHPDLYARAASLDGYAHALDDHYARGLWPPGYDGLLARLEHSPDWWVAHHAPEPVAVYLSAGTRDRDAASDAVRFWELLGA